LIIPEFGGFVLNKGSSKIYNDQGIITAPSKSITFNKNIKSNDGLLTHRLMQTKKISYEQANNKIITFSRKIRLDLYNNKLVSLPRIGKFYYDIENNLQFIPVSDNNYQLDSFGLSRISLRKIEPNKTLNKTKIIPINHEEELAKKNLNMTNLIQYAAIVILFIGFVLQHNYYNLKVNDFKNVQVSDLSESINSFVSSDDDQNNSPLIKNKDAINEVHKNLSLEVENLKKGLDDLKASIENNKKLKSTLYPDKMEVEKIKEEEKLIIPSPKITSNKAIYINSKNFNDIYIVVSAFRNIEKTENLVNKLQSKGYHVNLLKTETGWYRVAISQFAGFKQSELTLAKMKSTVNKGTWILAKN